VSVLRVLLHTGIFVLLKETGFVVWCVFRWFHRLGFVVGVCNLLDAIDPRGMRDVIPYAVETTYELVWSLSLLLAPALWMRYAVAIIYREATSKHDCPGWMRNSLIGLPFLYITGAICGSVIPGFVEDRFVFEPAHLLWFGIILTAYIILLALTYYKVRNVLQRFISPVRGNGTATDTDTPTDGTGGGKSGGGGMFNTKHLEESLNTLRRFIIVLEVIASTIWIANLIGLPPAVQKAIDNPNLPRTPRTSSFGVYEWIVLSLVHVMIWFILWYSWLPITVNGKRKAVRAQTMMEQTVLQ